MAFWRDLAPPGPLDLCRLRRGGRPFVHGPPSRCNHSRIRINSRSIRMHRMRRWAIIESVMTMLVLAFAIPSSPQVSTPTKKLSDDSKSIQFAVIGDYGGDAEEEGDAEKSVAQMVKSWDPDFIITLGDNNYPNGKAKTIVQNIGKYYCDYI